MTSKYILLYSVHYFLTLFRMKGKSLLVVPLALFVVLAAGCSSPATTPSETATAAPAVTTTTSDSGTSVAVTTASAPSFAPTVADKLTTGNFNYSKDDLSAKFDAMGIAANVTSGTKFSVMAEDDTIQIMVLDLKSASDQAPVQAALDKNFAQVKSASAKYVTKTLSIGGSSAVVGMVYSKEDAKKAAQVEAALNK